jgi:hypothetical protein
MLCYAGTQKRLITLEWGEKKRKKLDGGVIKLKSPLLYI